jgi:hypothetical protein
MHLKGIESDLHCPIEKLKGFAGMAVCFSEIAAYSSAMGKRLMPNVFLKHSTLPHDVAVPDTEFPDRDRPLRLWGLPEFFQAELEIVQLLGGYSFLSADFAVVMKDGGNEANRKRDGKRVGSIIS